MHRSSQNRRADRPFFQMLAQSMELSLGAWCCWSPSSLKKISFRKRVILASSGVAALGAIGLGIFLLVMPMFQHTRNLGDDTEIAQFQEELRQLSGQSRTAAVASHPKQAMHAPVVKPESSDSRTGAWITGEVEFSDPKHLSPTTWNSMQPTQTPRMESSRTIQNR